MPFVYFGIGWLIGIWAASALQLPTEVFLALTIVPSVGFFLWRTDRRAKLIWIGMIFAIAGGVRYNLALPHFDQNSLATYNNIGEATIDGVVDADPDIRDTYINLRVNADRITLPDKSTRPIEGTLLARPTRPAEFKYGERVRVSGELTTPTESATFSYKDFLARQGIYSMIDRPRITILDHDQGSPIFAAIYAFRGRAREVITQILPEPQASLLNGILLGDDSGLPADVQDEFRRTGTTHIIAISGYNITILISLMSVVVVRLFGRRRAFPILVIGLVVYTIMVGASASVVRASIMGILTLLAIYLGRQAAALNSLFIAGFLMTALDPNTLSDVGFQLSFAATLGLVVYARPFADSTMKLLTRLFPNDLARKTVGVINDALLVTLAAQVATLPLLVYYFRQLSLVSLIVNPLVLPAQTGVMAFGLLALTAGLITIPLGQIVGWSAWVFLAWTTGVIHIFASIPGAAIPLDYVPPFWVVAYYAVLIGATWYLKKPSDQRPKTIARWLTWRNVIFGGGLAVILIGVALSWLPDGKLHIIALDVDGHPVFVRTPANHKILIGGSNSPSSLLAALGNQLPFWDRDLDLVIAPQANASQLNGLLGVLDRYTVHQVMSVEIPTDNRAGREWQTALSGEGLQPIDLQPIEIDRDVTITFDESSALIGSRGNVIAIGPSDRAQINFIAAPIDRLPERPQMIFAWTPVLSDTRVIDLNGHGAIDLTLDASGLSINAAR